jgi:hypothetical protein
LRRRIEAPLAALPGVAAYFSPAGAISMHQSSRLIAAGMLLAVLVTLAACAGDGAPLANGTNSTAAIRSKKFWDRCNNGECPPMDQDDRPERPKPE